MDRAPVGGDRHKEQWLSVPSDVCLSHWQRHGWGPVKDGELTPSPPLLAGSD